MGTNIDQDVHDNRLPEEKKTMTPTKTELEWKKGREKMLALE